MLIQYLVALLAGASLPLAFAPFTLWPVALVSPAILLFQISIIKHPRTSFMLAMTYGLGYFGIGISWIFHSLHVFGHAPEFVAGGLTFLLILEQSFFIASLLFLYQRLYQRYQTFNLLWLIPVLWFSMEWLKGWLFTGFPWLSIGYSHVSSPLSGFAPIIGVYGIGSLSLLISVCLTQWMLTRKLVIMLPAVLVLLIGYGLQQVEWTAPYGTPLSVVMVQGNIDQDKKWRPEERANILTTYWTATKDNLGKDLIVWPEVAIPGRKDVLQTSVLNPITQHMKNSQSHLLTGILETNPTLGGYYNSMILLGENQGSYYKRHLVPFGEYYPFRDLLEFMKNYIRIPRTDTLPGDDHQPLMSVKGVKLGISICYEDVFSRDINLDLPEANMLVNTSNDAWFGDSLAPHQHLEIAQMRSLETERPMVRATNTGKSAFIDHKGKLISLTRQFQLQTLSAQMQGRQGATPFITFAKIQPWLAWLILILTLIFAFRKIPNK